MTAASAGAAVGPGVLVIGPNGHSGFVGGAAIQAQTPVEPTPYLLRSLPGEAGETTARRGVPVGKVIKEAGVPFDGSGYLTVPRANGTTAYIRGEDFEEPSPVFEEGKPALITVDQASTRFFRPVTSSTDVNIVDSIATVSGEALTIGVHEGNLVELGVTPSTTSTSDGSSVTFSATVTDGVPGEKFELTWSFGDGTATTGGESESVSHAFAGSGTYEVRVTATGSDGSGGESGPVAIVVGDPPTTAQPGATSAPPVEAPKPIPNGPRGKGTAGRGGRNSKPGGGGGTGKSAEAGSPGGSDGSRPARHPDRRHRPRHSTSEKREASPELPPEPTPAEPAPAVETPPVADAEAGLAAEGEGVAPTGPPGAAQPAASRGHDRTAPSTPAGARGDDRTSSNSPAVSPGELVEGRLVGDPLGASTVEEEVGGSAAGSGARSAAGQVSAGGVGVPLGAVVVACLLAAGAAFEWRRSRPIR